MGHRLNDRQGIVCMPSWIALLVLSLASHSHPLFLWLPQFTGGTALGLEVIGPLFHPQQVDDLRQLPADYVYCGRVPLSPQQDIPPENYRRHDRHP
jgi:hypothetical protein